MGIYLSGTGNTKHCVERLVCLLDTGGQVLPMECEDAGKLLSRQKCIVLAYSVQFLNVPVMVRDFITAHSTLWKGKQVICLATMGLFSGDGAGCAARLLKRCGAEVVGGLHLKMPDSICDVKLLKRSLEKNRAIIAAADRKIERWAARIKGGRYPREGLHFYNRAAGFLCQRFWFRSRMKDYSGDLKISDACMGCGTCISLCPMQNLSLNGKKAAAKGRCTMCYRCISACPVGAVTLLGKKVVERCGYEKYI